MAREMGSPRARSMSGRLAGQTAEQPANSNSPAAVVPAMTLAVQASMTQAVTVGKTAQARLQAATQLRNLNRSTRSTSNPNLAAIVSSGSRERLGRRSPSPEVLMSAVRAEQLVPPPMPSEASSPLRAPSDSNGSRLPRIESNNTQEQESSPEQEAEPELEERASVSFADGELPDEETGLARP